MASSNNTNPTDAPGPAGGTPQGYAETLLERKKELARCFPGLTLDQFDITSERTTRYNCLAYAIGKNDVWWEPVSPRRAGYYWPEDASLDDKIETLVCILQGMGYEDCNNGEQEEGYQKIAVYCQDGAWEHAALQKGNKWSSKLGPDEDIEHDTLDCLTGEGYGPERRFMRRRIQQPPDAPAITPPP